MVADLATGYMELSLRNPLIVGSSGLTQSVDGVLRCAGAGAGAVVLKSVFEEQIDAELSRISGSPEAPGWHPEAEDYIRQYGEADAVGAYLELIAGAKRAVEIPVIASVHCVTAGAWTEYARRVEEAGADALELNLFVLPSDPRRNARANEKVYLDVVDRIRRKVSIPVALKIGTYFSGLGEFVVRLSRSGVRALVLFNRFYRLDFDIDRQTVVPASILSDPGEIAVPLRWISILSGKVGCDLAAATGIHDGEGAIKQLLAGAAAVEVCSALYRNGVEHLRTMLDEVEAWMARKGYDKIEAFRGRMSQRESDNPAAFERVQFMMSQVGIE
jgi:dihydroorotate dehydrogenase (fumarate)